MARQVKLPAELNIRAAKDLHNELRSARGEDVELDASDVTLLGGLGLQLLLAAKSEWQGASLTIKDPSAPFVDCAKTLGAEAALLPEDQA